jgi:threonine synthase
MNTSGRTPLLRARKIETHFGLEEIYLKLEGTNPNGHKYDRIGEIVIRDALAGGYGTVLFDGPRRYLRSVRAYAEDRGLDILVPLFKNQAWKAQDFQGNQLVDLKRVSYDDRIAVIEELCEKRNVYNGATGYHNSHLSILALEEIGNELIERMEDIDSIFVQLSYGYTVSSLYNSFFREWVRGSINGYPQIYSCTIPKGNRIFEDYKQRNEIPSIDDYDIKINKYTKELYIDNTALLEESLKSVRDTSGEILGVDEQTLKEATAFLRKAEHLKVSAEEAYSFAGFYAMARAGKLKGAGMWSF